VDVPIRVSTSNALYFSITKCMMPCKQWAYHLHFYYRHTDISMKRAFSSRLVIFMAMKIHVVVFWVMTLCSDVVGYQFFGGPCCLHL
jgi:hypothetical protein